MKKLKHVKLFESFSSTPAQLIVTGDWTGITKDAEPVTFIHPATYTIKYVPAGSPIPSGYEGFWSNADRGFYDDLDSITVEAFGGDQNGTNVSPQDFSYLDGNNSQYAQDVRKGVLRILVDPSLSQEAIESHLRSEFDDIFASDDEEMYGVSEMTGEYQFEPHYLKLAREGKVFPRRLIFNK